MNVIQRVAATAAGALALATLSVPSASIAAAAPRTQPPSSSTTWSAPWSSYPAPGGGTCLITELECASTTAAGDVSATVQTASASTGWYTPRHEQRAAVLVTEVVQKAGVLARTYTATVTLHTGSTSGDGYAELRGWLVGWPSECREELGCGVGGDSVRLSGGEQSPSGDVTVTLSVRLANGLTALPTGSYTIAVGVIAGISQHYADVYTPTLCGWGTCYQDHPVQAGVGTGHIAATVTQVSR